jgi:hypothetical protein
MTRKFWIALLVGLGLCLAVGIIWTIRLDVPSPTPWWYGKKAVVRVEVWEPGRDMATFAMTMPKGPLDAFYALGLKGTIDLDNGREVELNRVWKRLQRLPRGERLTFEEDDATISLWIEVPNGGAGSPAG